MKKNNNKNFENTLENYLSDDIEKRKLVDKDKPLQVFAESPLVMELVGVKNLPVEISISTVSKVLQKHDLPIETLKQVPKAMTEPIMVFDSAKNGSIVLMLDLQDKKGATVIVPIALDLDAGYFKINEVKSIYGRTESLGKNNTQSIRKPDNEWFIEQVKSGNLKYIDHKKSLAWADQHGLWLPSDYTHRDKSRIYTNDDLVKLKEEKFKNKENNVYKPVNTLKISPQEEFKKSLQDLGLEIQGLPVMDGTVQRCNVIGKEKGKDGAYCGYLDGRPAGWAINYVTNEKIKFVSQGTKIEFTPAQKLENQKKLEERERARASSVDEVAKFAQEKWNNSKPATSHPYLEKKGVQSYGIRQSNNQLIIPVMNEKREIRGLQYINEDGSKFFSKGTEKKGNFLLLNRKLLDDKAKIYICEGFATGASIAEATNSPTVIAFDANNLREVSLKMKELYPKAQLTICADNDHIKAENIGLKKGIETAELIKATLKVPRHFNDKNIIDFNDVHKIKGIDELRSQLGIFKKLENTQTKQQGKGLSR